ncbi:GLPGLI family protein [Chryseobacterium soldanellicola]|uniref:GLPGLI family protein n=1 Tax=Chryseobacterium soldanellicola TaxID=311333 RepID=A0A1H1B7R5_9FLAO|nr:GLPGLI family protein [Chryseobacterium soldanellicola]SDQ47446.1 GLPGLI family protein [Chryseobacterium soldanellicola]
MKNKTITILTVFFISISLNNLFAQYLKVEYERTELQDFKNSSSSQEYIDKVNKVKKIPQKNFLYFANGNSFFKNIPRVGFVHDAGTTQIDESNRKTKKEVYTDFETKIYHIKNEKGSYQYQNYQRINEEFYGYVEMNYKKVDYKDDILKIDNYFCKLVEVTFPNEQITKIWYTEDIPISSGPYGFNTFPGVVLRIEAPSYIMTAVRISNDTKENDVEKLDPKLKIYKGEEFTKKMQEVRELNSKPTYQEIRL